MKLHTGTENTSNVKHFFAFSFNLGIYENDLVHLAVLACTSHQLFPANVEIFLSLLLLFILIFIMIFILGFTIWDRRNDPVRKLIKTHDARLEKLEKITHEHAKKDPVFAEVLKMTDLL
jgi:uncharacterized protein YacL